MSMTIKPTPEIYREAARIIEDGWATDLWVKMIPGKTGIPCYCMEGAIMKAAGLKPTFDNREGKACDLIYYADAFVAKKTKEKFHDCVDYNDSRKSAKPVIKMLNDIADALEKEEGE